MNSATGKKQVRGRFVKGQSGNPGGRPKGPGLGAVVRKRTRDGEEIIEFLLGIMRGKKNANRDRIKAAEILADRGWGKPQQKVELSTPEGEAIVIEERLGEAA